MSKKKKIAQSSKTQTTRSEPHSVCAYPALAAWLSWNNKISEEEAQKAANMFARFSDPGRAKIQLDRCESPAERLFLLGGMLVNDRNVRINFAKQDAIEEAASRGHWFIGDLVDADEDRSVTILQQHQIDEFRVDFYIPDIRLVVEIDGFEFHGQKEQFIADKQRDRSLMALGYRVARFSGSEVYGNPTELLCELSDLCSCMTPDQERDMQLHQIAWSTGYEAGYDKCTQEFTVATDPPRPQLSAPAEAAE